LLRSDRPRRLRNRSLGPAGCARRPLASGPAHPGWMGKRNRCGPSWGHHGWIDARVIRRRRGRAPERARTTGAGLRQPLRATDLPSRDGRYRLTPALPPPGLAMGPASPRVAAIFPAVQPGPGHSAEASLSRASQVSLEPRQIDDKRFRVRSYRILCITERTAHNLSPSFPHAVPQVTPARNSELAGR